MVEVIEKSTSQADALPRFICIPERTNLGYPVLFRAGQAHIGKVFGCSHVVRMCGDSRECRPAPKVTLARLYLRQRVGIGVGCFRGHDLDGVMTKLHQSRLEQRYLMPTEQAGLSYQYRWRCDERIEA